MELWIGALNLGLLYAFMTMGVFVTFRVHNFPDITVDGSFTAGGAVGAVLLISGVNPFLALIAAFGAGALAGAVTALIHTRLSINGLLAGILVMTGLYSTNLHIMGRSNIPLLNQTTFLTYLEKTNPGLHMEIWILAALCCVLLLFWLAAALFFRTDLGLLLRATGSNQTMAAAAGVNVANMQVFGIALANGMVGLSGGLVAQYQGFADVGMGIGTVVVGLAAVIVGESILKVQSMALKVLGVILGSIIFRLMIALALTAGMNPLDLKLMTAAFVLLTLVASKKLDLKLLAGGILSRFPTHWIRLRWKLAAFACLCAAAAGAVLYQYSDWSGINVGSRGLPRIGVVQYNDSGPTIITRDSLIEELKRLGYRPGENCIIDARDANGDMPTISTILDKFARDGVDVVVTISTSCTQVAVQKIKDRPIVFATVANPFIIDAGKSDTDHMPNVTGVYGWIPMDKTLEIVNRLFPGKIKVGCLWNPAEANAAYNIEILEKALQSYPDMTFVGTNIAGTADVYQSSQFLVEEGVHAFVLVNDHLVYAAFDSVIKATRPKKIPVILGDVERVADGAFAALGYDYSSSGQQAAHLVDRILKGEDPKQIPFERYKRLTFAVNGDVADEMGIKVPEDLLQRAKVIRRGAAGSGG